MVPIMNPPKIPVHINISVIASKSPIPSGSVSILTTDDQTAAECAAHPPYIGDIDFS